MDKPTAPPPDDSSFVRSNERVGEPRYVVIATEHGWQLLLEYADRYLRWVLRGAPGKGGQAVPDTDAAAASLEDPAGSLHKPALEREGNEIGSFRNVRQRDDGEAVSMGECLEEGVFELEFSGKIMNGRWRLSRSGSARRSQETWTLLRVMDNDSESKKPGE